MSLYNPAKPVADVTYNQLLMRRFFAAADMLGLNEALAPTYANELNRTVMNLEVRCIKKINSQSIPCPSCGQPMQAGMRQGVEAPFIVPRCFNRECECNKGRKQEVEVTGKRSDTWGT